MTEGHRIVGLLQIWAMASNRETEQQIERTEGIAGRFRYWKPFEAHAVERLRAEHQGYVIDFGTGHSVFEDAGLFARVQRALAPYPNVVLILPSADVDESIRVLAARTPAPNLVKPGTIASRH